MKNIIKLAKQKRKKPVRIRKELLLDESVAKKMQRELDRMKNEKGIGMSWQTFFEAACEAFLDDIQRRKTRS